MVLLNDMLKALAESSPSDGLWPRERRQNPMRMSAGFPVKANTLPTITKWPITKSPQPLQLAISSREVYNTLSADTGVNDRSLTSTPRKAPPEFGCRCPEETVSSTPRRR